LKKREDKKKKKKQSRNRNVVKAIKGVRQERKLGILIRPLGTRGAFQPLGRPLQPESKEAGKKKRTEMNALGSKKRGVERGGGTVGSCSRKSFEQFFDKEIPHVHWERDPKKKGQRRAPVGGEIPVSVYNNCETGVTG